jgi:hypothetical protein
MKPPYAALVKESGATAGKENTMTVQTIEEVKRIAADWAANQKPADLMPTEKNAVMLVNYCIDNFGVVIASNLTKAYNALRDKLDLVPPAAPAVAAIPKTADELAQEEIARQHRDYMDSIKPQPSFDERVAADKAKRQKADAKKEQEDAKGMLAVVIAGYQCYRGPNQIDYSTTEMVQKELRGVRAGGDFVRLLTVVRQIIQQLPDHPKPGDVAEIVKGLNERSRQSSGQPKDAFGSDVKKVGQFGVR